MKQSRRWTAFLTVLLLAASLIFAQEGRAGPVRGCQLPGDPPTVLPMGDPDVPPYTVRVPSIGMVLWMTINAIAPGHVRVPVMTGNVHMVTSTANSTRMKRAR